MDHQMDSAAGMGTTGEESLAAVGEIDEDLSCPMCGYNLRGLRKARCPECGYVCEWEDLIDPTRRLHPYLFEHHPEKNVPSFLRTAVGTLLPRRFWRDLHPAQPGDRRRLILYWGVAMGIYVFGMVGFGLADSFNGQRGLVASITPSVRSRMLKLAKQSGSDSWIIDGQSVTLEEYMEDQLPTRVTVSQIWEFFRSYYLSLTKYFVAVVLFWPWLTFAVLTMFRWSMRRAKVLDIHVLRCVLYSFDVLFWVGGIFFLLGLVALLSPAFYPTNYLSGGEWAFVLIMGNYRLWVGYRRYLQFSHPFATVLASQIIVFLLLMPLYGYDLVSLLDELF